MSTSTGTFRCHYAGRTSGPRYEMWREEYSRRWIAADFEPIDSDEYVSNEIEGSIHSFVTFCTTRGTPMHMDRRDDPALAGKYLYVLLASGCSLHTIQRGRSVELAPGQMTLMSADEPERVTQLTRGHRCTIRVPRPMIEDFCRNALDNTARLVRADGDLVALLQRQIETAHRFGPKVDPAANYALAQHVLDLVGLCIGSNADAAQLARQRGLAAARLDAIKDQVLQDLAHPDMSLTRVATRHGLSVRYVQHLFERSGTSFTSFVLEHRLLLAHRLLREPKHRWRKVSDIAAAAGFSDISYFNRTFRARFGVTPREIRASADTNR